MKMVSEMEKLFVMTMNELSASPRLGFQPIGIDSSPIHAERK